MQMSACSAFPCLNRTTNENSTKQSQLDLLCILPAWKDRLQHVEFWHAISRVMLLRKSFTIMMINWPGCCSILVLNSPRHG